MLPQSLHASGAKDLDIPYSACVGPPPSCVGRQKSRVGVYPARLPLFLKCHTAVMPSTLSARVEVGDPAREDNALRVIMPAGCVAIPPPRVACKLEYRVIE